MNKQQLASKIWAAANKMRSKIDANEYKDYILGFIFYKFLSEQVVRCAKRNGVTNEDMPDVLQEEDPDLFPLIQGELGYFIGYDNLYSTWIDSEKHFEVANVRDALSAFTRLISPSHKKVFDGIFDTLQSGLKELGKTDADQTVAVRDLLALIKDIPMNGKQDYDVLGFIYEYLISQFAANAGKKAGEFYTPHEVSLLMSEIVAHHMKGRKKIEIYDPTSGSGSLLINIGKSIAKHIPQENAIKYYAQELKKNTFNLTRMNLIMRDIVPDNIEVRNGDTLAEDWPWFDENDREGTYNPVFVDAVVSNPPYSQKWTPPRKPKGNEQGENDERFDGYGIAPSGKADYAFLLHDLYHLNQDGIMTIVLPHGVLFRGDVDDKSEGSIRRNLIENDKIDAVIGLPADIFFGTGIPTLVMVLKKNRDNNDVLIIDASKHFKKEGKKNKLRSSDIKRIVDTYIARVDVPKFARVVSKQEIRDNGYNLNIPRYVNSSADPVSWDMYSTMFGGLPKSELADLDAYWRAFPGLYETLFAKTETPYTNLIVDNAAEAINAHPAVKEFEADYYEAFENFDDFLADRLLKNMLTLNAAQEEAEITAHIFDSLSETPLVDRFEAYQLFADRWGIIAQDLEIIQSEGFEATRKVDPFMVLKKEGDKEYEVQKGWVGRILPFELVQMHIPELREQAVEIEKKKTRLEQAVSEFDTILAELADDERDAFVDSSTGNFQAKEFDKAVADALAGVETPEIETLRDYLALSRKKEKLAFIAANKDVAWSNMNPGKDGTYPAKAVNSYIAVLRENYEFPEDSYEARLVAMSRLLAEQKSLKTDIKVEESALHNRTKTVIEEELTDGDIYDMLHIKWIVSLCENLNRLPGSVINDFIAKVNAIVKKYDTTLVEVEADIREASSELSDMIDQLTADEYNLAALAQFKKLLND